MAGTSVQTTFLATTPSECSTVGGTGYNYSLITAKSENASYWTDRPCNGSLDYRDGTLGCFGQYFRSTNVDYVWTIWQWQAKSSSKASSGKRHNKGDSLYVFVQQYIDANAANAKTLGYCQKITLKDAVSLYTTTAALAAGILATLF